MTFPRERCPVLCLWQRCRSSCADLVLWQALIKVLDTYSTRCTLPQKVESSISFFLFGTKLFPRELMSPDCVSLQRKSKTEQRCFDLIRRYLVLAWCWGASMSDFWLFSPNVILNVVVVAPPTLVWTFSLTSSGRHSIWICLLSPALQGFLYILQEMDRMKKNTEMKYSLNYKRKGGLEKWTECLKVD